MSARITIERILRDEDDASGQTVRNWTIESERTHVTVKMKHGDGFISMRPDDVDIFIRDLVRALGAARSLAAKEITMDKATERPGYPVIFNGDHAEFEREHANTPPKERPDWPLPSFDARDWAKAFCDKFLIRKIDGHQTKTLDFDEAEGLMLAWFSGALMRGFDENAARNAREAPARDALLKEAAEALERFPFPSVSAEENRRYYARVYAWHRQFAEPFLTRLRAAEGGEG